MAAPFGSGEEDAVGAGVEAGARIRGQGLGDGADGGVERRRCLRHPAMRRLPSIRQAADDGEGREDRLDKGHLAVQPLGDEAQCFQLLTEGTGLDIHRPDRREV